MKPLGSADQYHLRAAEGWLELGNRIEAQNELEKISSEGSGHPSVLRLRWQIFASLRHWQTVIGIARAICRLEAVRHAPLLEGPMHLQHGNSGGRPASNEFSRAAFPQFFAIPYNLACHECRLGNLQEAWSWFTMAAEMADIHEVQRLALNDPDLKPLWPQISEL